jgi:hypothetical protein
MALVQRPGRPSRGAADGGVARHLRRALPGAGRNGDLGRSGTRGLSGRSCFNVVVHDQGITLWVTAGHDAEVFD